MGTKIAIMYDFDKTLCTKDMQEYGFIDKLGMKSEEFWGEVDTFAKENEMCGILTYMYLMLKKSREKSQSIRRGDFVKLGEKIEFFDGVIDWFDRITKYGKDSGVEIEHYIISSGVKEIIEGSKIADKFKKIYACEFLYDENSVAVWAKLAVNYTAKTQFLFRINKGVLDVWDNKQINNFVLEDQREVPFRNMIYIGDGLTDVPCMKLVKMNGGQSIVVYPPNTDGAEEKAAKLFDDDRVSYVEKADYSENGDLDLLVKDIIDKMVATDKLVERQIKQKKS